jgi:hypothetical protein
MIGLFYRNSLVIIDVVYISNVLCVFFELTGEN